MVIVVVVLILITRYINEKRLHKNVMDASQVSFDLQPIKNFVDECIYVTLNDGLVKLGKQGGYLFTSQGGTVFDYPDSYEGEVFVRYGGYKVIYNILKPRFQVGDYFPSDPKYYTLEEDPYPWKTFPYGSNLNPPKNYQAKDAFGTNMMPPLIRVHGAHSVQEQLETFVQNNLDNCITDFSVFEEQGFNINEKEDSERVITLDINRDDILLRMEWPIIIENTISGEKTELKDFQIKPEIRLRQLYSFVNSLIEFDISDVQFVIESGSGGGFNVEKKTNIYNNDDLIIVTDEKSLIDGLPYQYLFMRKNRNPALEFFIGKNGLGDSRCKLISDRFVDCEFKWWYEPSNCGCCDCSCGENWDLNPEGYSIKSDYFPEEEYDPNEDDLFFKYSPELTEYIKGRSGGSVSVTQTVSDGKLEDWQIVTFYAHWEGPQNSCGCDDCSEDDEEPPLPP